jgi:uncharacterized membrane protein YozB (DUF420 family)
MVQDGPKINRDAMRTTIWQILVSTFTAAYFTLYVALALSPNPIPAWEAGLVAMVLAILLAGMILVLFLGVVRINPKKVFKWTDALIDWSLRKQK